MQRHNPYQDMRWQTIDKILKGKLKRCIVNIDKRAICWYREDNHFDYGEFYHTFGVPGIWFQGFLPTEEFAKEPNGAKYSYFEFEIKNMEHFYDVLEGLLSIKKQELIDALEES